MMSKAVAALAILALGAAGVHTIVGGDALGFASKADTAASPEAGKIAAIAPKSEATAPSDPHADHAAHVDHAAHTTGPEKKERKVLFYRNPMGRPDTSPVPKKDEMGMDYIPVYADEAAGDGPTVKVSLDRVQKSGVRTEAAKRRPFTHAVKAPGVAKPDERTLRTVSLRADGFIEKLYVNETGQRVEAGEPLFRLYSQPLVNAQVDYRTAMTTPGRGPRDEEGALQRLRNLDLPEDVLARLRQSTEPVMEMDWPSPASGVILEKKLVEGQMARTGDELYRIADTSKVWIIADVAEQDIARFEIGASAKVTFRALPGESFDGKVTFVLPSIDAATRTAKARIELDNPGNRIKYEMYASVEIATSGHEPRIVIPSSAVIDSGERQVVLVERGEGLFDPRPVKLGARSKDLVEVEDGLAEGEKVVVSANFLIDAEANLQAALKPFTKETSQ
jgi:Cu(I)/Ag(I) efflux system membrane fusion protein